MTDGTNGPVAILDKELENYPSYRIETFELCDCCGARFAIGYHRVCKPRTGADDEATGLSNKLRQMLAEDHGHHREHKHFTEIWLFSE